MRTAAYLGGLTVFAICGACSRTPTRIDPPDLNASEVAQQAMELYDRNADGQISAEEAQAAPSLHYALQQPGLLDTSGDDQISRQEIAERVESWQQSRAGLAPVRCVVLLDGRPLAGATVTYDPAEFLPESVKPAFGETDEFGEARMSLRPDDLPGPNAPRGVQLGWYRVRVSKIVNGEETIPPKYNSDTVLGQEVSFQDPGLQSKIVHQLTSP